MITLTLLCKRRHWALNCQTSSATKQLVHLRLDWCDPGRRRCKLIVIDDDVHSLMAAWWQPDSSRALAWQWLFSFFTTAIIALIITKSNTITKIGASYPKFGQTKTWDRIGWIRGKARYSLRKAINFEQRILRLWGTFSPLRNLAQWKETDRILERVATAWEQRLRRFPSAWSTLSTPSFASVHISNSVLRALQVGATPSLGLPSTACSIARTSSTFVHINCIGSHAAHFKHTRAGNAHNIKLSTIRAPQSSTDLKQGADTSLQVVAKFPRTDHAQLHLLAHKYIDTQAQIHKYTIVQIHP